ncbi:short-chain dehydrogenase [Hyaloraphidium curvatum]|nr:short-chain dehydrogenase [Hyaloraphidium curvatum]
MSAIQSQGMQSFAGLFGVVSGGGFGMGRQLVLQLAKEGCEVAFCDVLEDGIKGTLELCAAEAPGVKVTGHRADVAVEEDWKAFREAAMKEHDKKHLNVLICQAGIGGGGSFLNAPREEWERCFDISWKGVYLGNRTFIEDLKAAPKAWIANTSSINGFHAVLTIGDGVPQSSYAAAKHAIKGFSESLLTDFRLNAPHIGVSCVMPGHIGTKIGVNTSKMLNHKVDESLFERFETYGMPPAEAAGIILDGIRNGRWRILVGKDAEVFDREVRADPERAYEVDFIRETSRKALEARGLVLPPASN